MAAARFALAALWFLVPAGAANSAPVLVRGVPVLSGPVDGGRSWRGARVFGANKTWRGLAAAPLAGWLALAVQQAAARRWPRLDELWLVPELASAPAWYGAALGAGAILGDLAKSFFKRRARVAPGGSWLPFDQLDYALGALAALAALAAATSLSFPGGLRAVAVVVGVLAVGFAAHLAAVALGRLCGLRERWI